MSFLDPQNNIEQLELSEGMIVADLGVGSGFYTLAAAEAVGSSGRVYAIDVQKDMLDHVKNLAKERKLHNVEVIWADIEKLGGTRLKEAFVDIAIVSNVLFQIEEKNNFLNETKRILKPNGRVLVVDWADSFSGLGPAQENIVTRDQSEELFEQNGFELIKDISAGDHHYGMVFRKEIT